MRGRALARALVAVHARNSGLRWASITFALFELAGPRNPVVVCPVHPVTTRGTERIRVWRPARLRIVIGPSMDLSRFSGTADDRAAVRAATDALMRLLERQGGLEYVDRYARERPAGG
jgi:hypothetical protein